MRWWWNRKQATSDKKEDPGGRLAPAHDVATGPVACSSCGRTMDPRRVQGGPKTKVALLLPGQLLPFRCVECGKILCHECLPGETQMVDGEPMKTVSQTCPLCSSRMEVLAGIPPAADH